jgi:hypothetical protein
MKKILIAITLLTFVSVTAGAEPVFHEPTFVREKYTGQTSMTCNGQKFSVPSHFPFIDEKEITAEPGFYLIANSECNKNTFSAFLGIGDDCGGQHICSDSGFLMSRDKEIIDSIMSDPRKNESKKIKLALGRTGYFVPPICGTYCDYAAIIWKYNNTVYRVDLKTGRKDADVINEMIKSANSYIDNNQ